MQNKFFIRHARKRDIDEIAEIEIKCFSTPWSRNTFKIEIKKNKNAIYLAAETEKKVIGYIGMWIIENEGHILNVAVLPGFRNAGVATALIQSIEKEAAKKGTHSLTLEVRKSNIAAIELYTKMGFLKEGIRKNYYTDSREDAVIMWKKNLDSYSS